MTLGDREMMLQKKQSDKCGRSPQWINSQRKKFLVWSNISRSISKVIEDNRKAFMRRIGMLIKWSNNEQGVKESCVMFLAIYCSYGWIIKNIFCNVGWAHEHVCAFVYRWCYVVAWQLKWFVASVRLFNATSSKNLKIKDQGIMFYF